VGQFEAGALSKSLDQSRVAPFLFGVERTDVKGPLLQFQSTVYEKEDVKKLVRSINGACEEHGLDEGRVDEIFEVWWPRLEEKLDALDSAGGAPAAPPRSTQDIVNEVLELVRGQHKLLSNPDELLPAAYLEAAIGRGGNQLDPAVARDVLEAWRFLNFTLRSEKEPVPVTVEHAVRSLEGPLEYLLRDVPRRRVRRPPRVPPPTSPDEE
jgi:hypothetical protein